MLVLSATRRRNMPRHFTVFIRVLPLIHLFSEAPTTAYS